VVVAHPNYSKVFQIYTDVSSKQLGAVITQDNRPIAFFNWKLSVAQYIYSVAKIELLAMAKTLKDFKGILWGQSIKVFTDHKKSHERCSRLNLGPSVLMEVTAGRVWAQDCLYQRHTQYHCRCNRTA
jgi:hypothetical protein